MGIGCGLEGLPEDEQRALIEKRVRFMAETEAAYAKAKAKCLEKGAHTWDDLGVVKGRSLRYICLVCGIAAIDPLLKNRQLKEEIDKNETST